jgi:hypothetical protein
MSRSNEDDKTCWDSVMENFDLLFVRLNDIGVIQQDLRTQLEANSQRVDNFTTDQKLIAEQVKSNGHAVTQLTLRQFEEDAHSVGTDFVSIIFEEEAPFTNMFADEKGKSSFKPGTSKQHKHHFDQPRKESRDDPTLKKEQLPHHALPKMPFPNFAGDNPKIWINKCNNYFAMYSIPKTLWVTSATMHLDENAAMWWEAYKLGNPSVSWQTFCQDVQAKFDSDDYRSALADLIALKQTSIVEEYTT